MLHCAGRLTAIVVVALLGLSAVVGAAEATPAAPSPAVAGAVETTITVRPTAANIPGASQRARYARDLGPFVAPDTAELVPAMDATRAGSPTWRPATNWAAGSRVTGVVFRLPFALLRACAAGGNVDVRQGGSYQVTGPPGVQGVLGRQVLFSGDQQLRSRVLRDDLVRRGRATKFDGADLEVDVDELATARLAVFVRTVVDGRALRWDVDDLSVTVTFRDRCRPTTDPLAGAWLMAADDGPTAASHPAGSVEPTWLPARTDDEIVLRATGSHLLPASTPDTRANSITGDLDLRVDLTPTDWGDEALAAVTKWVDTVDALGDPTIDSYEVGTWFGLPFFEWTDPAEGEHLVLPQIPARTGSSPLSFRFTLDVDDGQGGHVAQYFEEDPAGAVTTADGRRWTLRDTQAFAGTTAIVDSDQPLEVNSTHDTFVGDVRTAQLYSGIDGTLVADFDPTRDARDVAASEMTSASSGETWHLSPGSLARTAPGVATVAVDSTRPLALDWPAGSVSFDRDFTVAMTMVPGPYGGVVLSSGDIPAGAATGVGWGLYVDPAGAGTFYATDAGGIADDKIDRMPRAALTVVVVRYDAATGELELIGNGQTDGPTVVPVRPAVADAGPVLVGAGARDLRVHDVAVWNRTLGDSDVLRVLAALSN